LLEDMASVWRAKLGRQMARLRLPEPSLPGYYVLLCALRYPAVAGELVVAATDEPRQVQSRLSYILESGLIEYKRESERRVRPYPDDLRRALIERDGSVISRSISQEESEMLTYASAIPAFPSIDN
jgi:hypothetical protein